MSSSLAKLAEALPPSTGGSAFGQYQQAFSPQPFSPPAPRRVISQPGAHEHKLRFEWTFWYMRKSGPRTLESYEKGIKPLGTVGSVEAFWAHYCWMLRPYEMPTSTDFHIFREGIKPMWEDAANRPGGKLVVRIRKGMAPRHWESVLMGIIGNQFDGNEVCGAVLSLRFQEDTISVWNRNATNTEAIDRIRETLRRVLNVSAAVTIDYKPHEVALRR